jgi:DNA helicase-2/ATP-dependent DNA helicase PcrA
MALLRAHCPRLNGEPLKRVNNAASLLAELKNSMLELRELMSGARDATLFDVLQFARKAELVSFDERMMYYLKLSEDELSELANWAGASSPADQGEEMRDKSAIASALLCPATQVSCYDAYINDDSPYSTQHGIKGAEFERVLVVLDDEEGSHNQFSYDKLFGLAEPSKQDIENRSQNKETVVDRTRRLFYVCCSRATRNLAIVLYSTDVANAAAQVKASQWFQPSDVCTFDEMIVKEGTSSAGSDMVTFAGGEGVGSC